MTTKIRKAIENNLGSMRHARCMRRVGALLATVPVPLAALRLIPDDVVSALPDWFDTALASWVLVSIILAGIALYVIGVVLFASGKAEIALTLRGRKGFVRIVEPAPDLVARLRALGARGETANSFVSSDTLTMLLALNADYVQASGKPEKIEQADGSEHIEYRDVCFFVVAPLKPAGVKAMLPDDYGIRHITRNRELKTEHVEKFPKRCVGLYIIELYGESRASRGAAEGKLFGYLNDAFGGKLSDSSFQLFARPATTDGGRVVKNYSFRNLGTEKNDMHVWQTIEEDQGICGFVLSLFAAK